MRTWQLILTIIIVTPCFFSAYSMRRSACSGLDFQSRKNFKQTLFDVIEKTKLFSLFYWQCRESDTDDLLHKILIKKAFKKQQNLCEQLLADLEFLLKMEVDNPYLSTTISRDEFGFFNGMVANFVETVRRQTDDVMFKQNLRKNFSIASLKFYHQLKGIRTTSPLIGIYGPHLGNIVTNFELIFAELGIDSRSTP